MSLLLRPFRFLFPRSLEVKRTGRRETRKEIIPPVQNASVPDKKNGSKEEKVGRAAEEAGICEPKRSTRIRRLLWWRTG